MGKTGDLEANKDLINEQLIKEEKIVLELSQFEKFTDDILK